LIDYYCQWVAHTYWIYEEVADNIVYEWLKIST